MSRISFILIVVIVALSAVCNGLPPKKCGKNEIWYDCWSPCPPTCDPNKPVVCPAICIQGCQCIRGFIKNNRNHCVPFKC